MLLEIVDKYDSIIVQNLHEAFEDYECSHPLQKNLATTRRSLFHEFIE